MPQEQKKKEGTNAIIKPVCDDDSCGGEDGHCTEVFLPCSETIISTLVDTSLQGTYDGCDCIIDGTAVAQTVALAWLQAEITMLSSASNAYLQPTPTNSTISSTAMQTSTALSTPTPSCWTSYPYLICRLPEETTTSQDGHIMQITVCTPTPSTTTYHVSKPHMKYLTHIF